MAFAIAAFVVAGSTQLLLTTSWNRHPDEAAHAGYARSLASGRLPTIDTPIEGPSDADRLKRRLDSYGIERGDPHRKVWVANHPPGAYALSAPFIALGIAVGGDSLSYTLRLANVLAGAVVIWLVAKLTFELTGDDLAAAVAALLMVALAYPIQSLSTGLTDGWALVFAVAVIWRGVVAWQRGFDARSMWQLGAVIAGCGLVRLTSLGVGVAVAVTCLAAETVRTRSLPGSNLVRCSLPPVVFAGWFYVRNWRLYGDVAGSEQLLDRFNRTPRGSLIGTLGELSIWTRLVRVVLGEPTDFVGLSYIQPGVWSTCVALVGALAVVVVTVVRARDLQRRDAPDRLSSGWVLLAAASVASLVMAAQHVSGGGNPYGRYLLVVAPLWSCTVGAALVGNGSNRWRAALLATALLVVLSVRQFAAAYDSYAFVRDYASETATGIKWATRMSGLYVTPVLSVGGILCVARLVRDPAGRREEQTADH